MADIEFGKCDICGKEAALSRTYFIYRMESCTFDDGAPFGVKVEE